MILKTDNLLKKLRKVSSEYIIWKTCKPVCYKPNQPLVYLIKINKPRSLQNFCKFKDEPSNFHKMTLTLLKSSKVQATINSSIAHSLEIMYYINCVTHQTNEERRWERSKTLYKIGIWFKSLIITGNLPISWPCEKGKADLIHS